MTGGKSNADRFPASLPGAVVALKLARKVAVPSDCAALSATLQLDALVRVQPTARGGGRRRVSPESWLENANLRHLARHLDAAAGIVGRQA